jgi:hypothetical protein
MDTIDPSKDDFLSQDMRGEKSPPTSKRTSLADRESKELQPDLNLHKDPCNFQNEKIYHHVYEGLREEEIVPAIEHTVEAMVAGAETDLLILLDARGVKFDRKALAAFKRTSHFSKHVIKKIAVLGIHEIQIAFLNYISTVFKLNIRAFEDIDKAKRWLVE